MCCHRQVQQLCLVYSSTSATCKSVEYHKNDVHIRGIKTSARPIQSDILTMEITIQKAVTITVRSFTFFSNYPPSQTFILTSSFKSTSSDPVSKCCVTSSSSDSSVETLSSLTTRNSLKKKINGTVPSKATCNINFLVPV